MADCCSQVTALARDWDDVSHERDWSPKKEHGGAEYVSMVPCLVGSKVGWFKCGSPTMREANFTAGGSGSQRLARI